MGAEDKIQAIENKIYAELQLGVTEFIQPIQQNAQMLAKLDVLVNFAVVAEKNYYVRPEVDDQHRLDIKGGRHPVIEKNLPVEEDYITNDTFLD